MKWMGILGKVERVKFYIGMFLVGLLFIGISAFVISRGPVERVSVEATITDIRTRQASEGEETYLIISYTDHNGVTYSDREFNGYTTGNQIGDKITLEYEKEHPENISSPGGEYIPYVFLAIGIIAVVLAVVLLVKGIREKSKNFYEVNDDSNSQAASDAFMKNASAPVTDDLEPEREYYFHFTGKMNQSYIMETPERAPMYTANCDKIAVFTPYEYTFTNMYSGASFSAKVTHTLTSRYGTNHGNGLSTSVPTNSSFKINGVNCWEYLHKLGYAIAPSLSGIKLNFDIKKNGQTVARLEAAGTNIIRDDKQSKLGEVLPGPGLYKVFCKSADIEGVFMAAFIASRVEFF